jgi:SAM-dependent methyltransferase
MDAEEYVRMAQVQDRHWWFEAKRRTVAALLERHAVAAGPPAAAAASPRVLEVGPGTGSMIDVMTRYGRVCAAEAYLPALRLLVEHRPAAADLMPVGADLLELPFADASFALIGCFDVLYHQKVRDVGDALAELHRVCAPGGHLVITDSAFAVLRSSHDVATHAARRFRLRDLSGPLQRAGFTIEHATYFHTLLFPAALAVRLGKRLLHGSPQLVANRDRRPSPPIGAAPAEAGGMREVAARSDLAPVPGWLNALLLCLYRVETPLSSRFRLPFGSSLLILARRPG